MKKTLFTLLSITLFSCNGQTQNKIDFNLHYTPETVYTLTMAQNSSNKILYSGSEEFLNSLKERGTQNPTISKDSSIMESLTVTDKETKGRIPLTMEFVKTGSESLPDRTVLHGYCLPNKGGMPVLDSIVSEGMDYKSRQMLLNSLQSTFKQFDLPRKKLKVGESFSQELPLSIPVADVIIDMNIMNEYDLVEILEDTAYFNIKQTCTMTSTFDQMKVNASGSGNGQMNYLISKNFYSLYHLDLNIDMSMEVNGIELELKTSSSVSQKVKIERKKASR